MLGYTRPLTLSTIVLISLLSLIGCGNAGPAVDLWTAAATGDIAVLQQHVDAGVDLDSGEPAGGSSPLIVAALFGQTEAVTFLIEHGAGLDVANHDGSTALHVAAFFGHPEVVELLLAEGADPEVRNRFGQTPLETVAGEWTPDLEAIYEQLGEMWRLELDLERIRTERPRIAERIRQTAA